MNILIDGTNIISGGGVSHLTEMLNATTQGMLAEHRINCIVVVGIRKTLEKINDQEWLIKVPMTGFESSLLKRQYWKRAKLKQIVRSYHIHIIFNPGGSFYSKRYPYVTMSRNMLVFETKEANRYGFSLYRLKFFFLRILQTRSIQNAAGVIFISKYSWEYIQHISKVRFKNAVLIHHGISDRFRNVPAEQLPIHHYSDENPFKILYISTIDAYKHFDNVAIAIDELSNQYPVQLIAIGGKAHGYDKFEKILQKNPTNIKYLGNVSFSQIHEYYKSCNLFVYASTCENMPNILLEAMTAGLPIACSKKAPMPEFLKDAGAYFDAENPTSIRNTVEALLRSPEQRAKISHMAAQYSQHYSWRKCAKETFQYISSLV
ncbi:MAG: glycosyltransferase family 4 protein [Niabella sp.]|nr:glycosyltransferase family 4 protein [Niabella sp.]